MIAPEKVVSAYLENRALLLLLFAVSLAFGWILLPFYSPILWACIIALLFAPVHRRLLVRLKGRRTPAALFTLFIALVLVIVPLVLIGAALAREAIAVYARLQSGEWTPGLYFHRIFDAMPAWTKALFDRFGLFDFDTLQQRLTVAMGQASQFIAARMLGIGQDTFAFIAELFITVYIAFFLIRDGDAMVEAVRRSIPLSSAHKKELIDKFAAVLRATVKGNLLVAAIQGAMGGLAFWFLGVRAALLWAVLMAFLSLLPAVGAALVWFPLAVYFLVIGELWQGMALAAYGVLVIGLVDNLLRPILVGKDTRMPDYLVMIATLGGLAVFGINGFVLGPMIAAMFIAVWHMYVTTRSSATP